MREIVTHVTAQLQSGAAIDSFVLKRRMQINYLACMETQLEDLPITESTRRQSEDQQLVTLLLPL